MRKLLIALLFAFPLSICNAQSTTVKPVEPTAIGVVFRLDPTTQELKRLPDEEWKKSSRFNVRVNFECVEVKGGSSSFRIKAKENTAFVFKTGSPEKVSLYPFILKSSKRSFDFNQGTKPIKGLPVEVSQFGEKSYKMIPVSPLTSGEYAINIAGEIYTFGIDR
jgi:hypothetical protein